MLMHVVLDSTVSDPLLSAVFWGIAKPESMYLGNRSGILKSEGAGAFQAPEEIS